jgi:hypothetical protein
MSWKSSMVSNAMIRDRQAGCGPKANKLFALLEYADLQAISALVTISHQQLTAWAQSGASAGLARHNGRSRHFERTLANVRSSVHGGMEEVGKWHFIA